MTYDAGRDGPLRSGSVNDPDDWVVHGPDFGEAGLPPGMASKIADTIMATPECGREDTGGVVPQGPRRNRHLDGDGYGTGR